MFFGGRLLTFPISLILLFGMMGYKNTRASQVALEQRKTLIEKENRNAEQKFKEIFGCEAPVRAGSGQSVEELIQSAKVCVDIKLAELRKISAQDEREQGIIEDAHFGAGPLGDTGIAILPPPASTNKFLIARDLARRFGIVGYPYF